MTIHKKIGSYNLELAAFNIDYAADDEDFNMLGLHLGKFCEILFK